MHVRLCLLILVASGAGCSLVADLDRAPPEGLGRADIGAQTGDGGHDARAESDAQPQAGDAGDASHPPDFSTVLDLGIGDADPVADAAEPEDAGATTDQGPGLVPPPYPCDHTLQGQTLRRPCEDDPTTVRAWRCKEGEWQSDSPCIPTPPHWCVEICTDCLPGGAPDTVDRIQIATAPPAENRSPYRFGPITGFSSLSCDGCAGNPPDGHPDWIASRTFAEVPEGLPAPNTPQRVADDRLNTCRGQECTDLSQTTTHTAFSPDPEAGLPLRFSSLTRTEVATALPASDILPALIVGAHEWWVPEGQPAAWRQSNRAQSVACAYLSELEPGGDRLSYLCEVEPTAVPSDDLGTLPEPALTNAYLKVDLRNDADGLLLQAFGSSIDGVQSPPVPSFRLAYDYACWHCPAGQAACVRRTIPEAMKCTEQYGRAPFEGRRPWSIVCQPDTPTQARDTCERAGGTLATVRSLDDLIALARFAPPPSAGDPERFPAGIGAGHLLGGRVTVDPNNDVEIVWPGLDQGGLTYQALAAVFSAPSDNGCLVVRGNGQIDSVPCDTPTAYAFACEFRGDQGIEAPMR